MHTRLDQYLCQCINLQADAAGQTLAAGSSRVADGDDLPCRRVTALQGHLQFSIRLSQLAADHMGLPALSLL